MTIEQLKLQIKEVIFPNGRNEIDGGKHQGVLLDLVDKFDVDVRDLARALNELSDELNNKDESQSNALRELADKVDEHVLYTDNELNKKVDNDAYNLDKEAIETSISENKTAIEGDIADMKEAYELDKEEQEETNTSLSNGISENKTAIESNKEAIDNKLALKLEKVYVDGTSIQGDGTKENPIFSTMPSEFEELLSYGVLFSGAEPQGIRVGNMDLHRKLPLQSQMRKCLLLDNGEVNYWLDPNNSLLNENGNSSRLDGTDGQVMVFLPQFWYKVKNTTGGIEYRISEKSISGYTHSPACYISAYEASLMRDESILSSVVNNTANYRGGNNNAEWDDKQQTLLGKPVTSVSLTNFIKYASNRGEDWYCNYYDAYKKMCFLYLVEYANRNSQSEFIANPTDEGFKQGGLGDGVTTLGYNEWGSFNSYNPFIPCGYTNGLGNNTGVKDFTMPSEYGELVVSVPSYRGIENPFGHIWKWTDGLEVAAGEETTELKVNGKYVGDLARDGGYIKSMLGEEIMPVEVGGGSTSYWCDRFYTNAKTSQGIRGVLFGGNANYVSAAGFFYSDADGAPSLARAHIGSRLCFFKRA